MIGPLLSEWYMVRPSAVQARPLETIRSSTIGCRPPSGSNRYSAAMGRDNSSSSIVPAQNRPSGETLPSLNRVPGTCSGPVKNRTSPVSKSSRWNPSTRATIAPRVSRSAKDPTRDGSGQLRFSPVAGSSRCMAGARMSIQYRTCSGTDHAGDFGFGVQRRRFHFSDLQLGLDSLQHPPVDVVGGFLPAEDADRGQAVEVRLPQGGEELVPIDVAVADFVVLMHAGVHAGWVDDVAVARVRLVVGAVGDVQVLQAFAGDAHH